MWVVYIKNAGRIATKNLRDLGVTPRSS